MTSTESLEPDAVDAALVDAKSPWSRDGNRLVLSRTFRSFREAVGFVVEVALLAEAADHHPDFEIHYNEVRLVLWTHVAGGVTQRDVDFAQKVASLSLP